MTREIFNIGIAELQIAFPLFEMTKARAEVWFKYSNYLTDEEWNKKMSNCIQRCYKNSPVLADILNRKEDDGYRVSKQYKTI